MRLVALLASLSLVVRTVSTQQFDLLPPDQPQQNTPSQQLPPILAQLLANQTIPSQSETLTDYRPQPSSPPLLDKQSDHKNAAKKDTSNTNNRQSTQQSLLSDTLSQLLAAALDADGTVGSRLPASQIKTLRETNVSRQGAKLQNQEAKRQQHEAKPSPAAKTPADDSEPLVQEGTLPSSILNDSRDDANASLLLPSEVPLSEWRRGLEVSMGDPGNLDRWNIMEREGMPAAQFGCKAGDIAKLFRVKSSLATSAILFNEDAISRFDGNSFDDPGWGRGRIPLGGLSEDDFDPSTSLSDVSISLEDAQKPGSTPEFLTVYSEPQIESGEILLNYKEPVRLAYVCSGVGEAIITLSGHFSDSTDFCYSWVKECNPSWGALKIIQSGNGRTVWENGEVEAGWQESLSREDAANAMSFVLTYGASEGTVRIKTCEVSSSNPSLKVSVRGAMVQGPEDFGEAEVVYVGNEQSEQIDVVYSCDQAVPVTGDVTLRIINESPALSPIDITWPSSCGQTNLTDVHAKVRSCTPMHPNTTSPTDLLQELVAMDSGSVVPELSSSTESLVISRHDTCTAFVLTSNASEPLSLFPNHQLRYERDIVYVANRIGTVLTSLSGETIINIPYVCLEEKVAHMSLTVHFWNRPSAEFRWRKECKSPEVLTSGGITGAGVLSWSLAAFLTLFMFWFISRSRTLSAFILQKLSKLFCCGNLWKRRSRASMLADERGQFTQFGAAV